MDLLAVKKDRSDSYNNYGQQGTAIHHELKSIKRYPLIMRSVRPLALTLMSTTITVLRLCLVPSHIDDRRSLS